MKGNWIINFIEFININVFSYNKKDIEMFKDWIISFGEDESAILLTKEIENLNQEVYSDKTKQWYSWIFEGTRAGISVPLWESAYKGGKNVLYDRTTLEVIKEYYSENLQPVGLNQPADYLGYEIEFLLYLIIEKKDSQKIEKFMKNHFLVLLRGIFENIKKTKCGGYYEAFSKFVLNNIKNLESYDFLGEEYIPKRNLWNHFDFISDEVATENLKEKIINTSGRGNCGGKCVIKAYTAAGCILHLESDTEDEDGAIKACARGRGYRKTFLNSDRLRYPMLRVGERGEGKFRRISWEEAVQIMHKELTRITEKYGVGSRYVNYGGGLKTSVRGDMLTRRLLAMDGGYLGNYHSYSFAGNSNALPYTYGTMNISSSMPTFKKSSLLIIWGYNPVVTQFNYMVFDMLKYHKEKGTPIIVIDPQFSDTAAVFATQWIGIKPGTDAALVAAMAYVLWDENLCDKEFMDKYCIGFDKNHMPEGFEEHESYKDYIYGVRDGIAKTPEWASRITGIDESIIIDLARQYALAKPAAILTGLAPQRRMNGEQTARSILILPCMTGNVGIEGGSAGAGCELSVHKQPSLSAGNNPYGVSIPFFMWTDAVLRGKSMTKKADHIRGRDKLESDVKMIFNISGNALLNQHSNINRTAEILKDTSKCEFIVVSDIFMTPSAQFADLLLPATSLFEEDSLTAPWREGYYLLYGNKVIEPIFEARTEYDWLKELANLLEINNYTDGCHSVRDWHKRLYEDVRKVETELPEFETFAVSGSYKYRENKYQIAFKEQIEDIEKSPFPTESGKIEVFSSKLLEFDEPIEIPPIPKYIPEFDQFEDYEKDNYPLRLIGWHTKRRCHSIHDNNDWMEELEPHRVWINSEDAKERGIMEEDLVEVFNDKGRAHLKAHVTSRIIKGFTCIPEGAWYKPNKDGIDLRGSANMFSTHKPTALGKANPQHSNLVEIKKIENLGEIK